MIDYQDLAALFRKVRLLRLVQLCLCVVAVVMVAIAQTRVLGFVLAAVTVCVYLFYNRRVTKQYVWEVIRANIGYGLCGGFPEVKAVQKGVLPEAVFDGWKMLPRNTGKGGNVLSLNGFSCKSRGKTVQGAETTVHYCVGSGLGRKSYNFLTGTTVWCEGSDRGDWLLIRQDLLLPDALDDFLILHGYKIVATGKKLAEDFLLCSREEGAQIPRELEREMESLVKGVDSLGALRLSESGNAIFLKNRFYTPKVHIAALPSRQELTKNTLPERDLIFRVLCGQ